MPKPVLSDSLFNADDVATAVLAEANLQVANNNLGVTDISSHFTLQSGWEAFNEHILFFNGFVWWSAWYRHTGGSPAQGEVFLTIDNADYRPQTDWRLPAIGAELDSASRINVATNGNISVEILTNSGSSTYHISTSYFWNVNF